MIAISKRVTRKSLASPKMVGGSIHFDAAWLHFLPNRDFQREDSVSECGGRLTAIETGGETDFESVVLDRLRRILRFPMLWSWVVASGLDAQTLFEKTQLQVLLAHAGKGDLHASAIFIFGDVRWRTVDLRSRCWSRFVFS
jgi:hypothetical protein